MCTVTWLFEEDGYQLLCNRDELHTRMPALSPGVRTLRDVLFIAPRDGDHCGSWIAVNEFGMSLCLLNRHQVDGEAASNPTSRGLLLWDLADSDSTAEVLTRICRTDLSRFRPFTLALFEHGIGATRIEWSGRQGWIETMGEGASPLSSSSYDSSAVARSRRVAYYRLVSRAGILDGRTLFRFHSSHAPARGPYSVCMHRNDARTVSFSWITVKGNQAQFRYQGDSPCTASANEFQTTRLSLRSRVAGTLDGQDLESLLERGCLDSNTAPQGFQG